MSDKDQKANNEADKATGCGCAQTPKGHGCPCKKRVCLPILGLVGIVVALSLAAKARKSR